MDWIEISARNVPAAVELALDTLGVHENELEYEVVAEPKTGFLGLGRSDARIRARVRPISREKPQDRRRRRKNETKRSSGSKGSGNGARGAKDDSERDAERKPERSGGDRNRQPRQPKDRSSNDTDAAKNDRRPNRAANGAATAAGESRSNNNRQRRQSTNSADNGRAKQEDNDMAEASISIDEQLSEAHRFTQGLIDAMDVTATVASRFEDDHIFVDVEGDGLGLLVGPKGATLSAVEELVRTAVVVRGGGGGARILVDVGGYRRKRREALAGFATRLAEEVIASGVAKALEPMSSSDRKVVHDTVADIDGVATSSEGEDPRRRVVIRPA